MTNVQTLEVSYPTCVCVRACAPVCASAVEYMHEHTFKFVTIILHLAVYIVYLF